MPWSMASSGASLLLLLLLTGSISTPTSSFSLTLVFAGSMFYLGRFCLFCTAFLRLLFLSSFVGWLLLLLLITDGDGRRSFPYFLPPAFLIILEPFNQPPEHSKMWFGQGEEVVWQFLPYGDNTFFVHFIEIVTGLLPVFLIGSECLQLCRLLRPLHPHFRRAVIDTCLCTVSPSGHHAPDPFPTELCDVLDGLLLMLQLLDESGSGLYLPCRCLFLCGCVYKSFHTYSFTQSLCKIWTRKWWIK